MIDFELIKKVAKEKKITLAELAKKVGYSEAGFHKAIQNKKLKTETLIKIGEALDLNLEHFIGDENAIKVARIMSITKDELGRPGGDFDAVSKFIERQDKFIEGSLTFFMKQCEEKDRQIDHLIRQLELKDGLIKSIMNYYFERGVIIDEQYKKSNNIED